MVTTGMSILYPKVRLQNEERHLSFHCLDEIPPNAPYPFLSLCLGNINGCSYLKIFLHSMLSLEMGFWHLNKPQEMMEVYLSKEHRTQPLHFLVPTWASYGKRPENMKKPPGFFHWQHLWYCCDLREKGTSQSWGMATSCSWRAPFQADLHCLQVQAIMLPSARITGSIMEGINDCLSGKLTMTCLKITPHSKRRSLLTKERCCWHAEIDRSRFFNGSLKRSLDSWKGVCLEVIFHEK